MKILQLSNRVPYPLNDGGNLGINFLLEGYLNAGVELSFLTMNTTKHWVNLENLPQWYHQLQYFEAVNVDNRIKSIAAFLNLFKKSSYNIDRFITKDFETALIRLLNQKPFDIIELESLYLTPYVAIIRKYSSAKIIIRQHNVEYKIWERLAIKENHFFKKKYLTLLTKRLKKFEISHINDYDLLLPISKQDADIFKSLGLQKPFYILPFGINIDNISLDNSLKKPISLYHIGAMDWLPNQESVIYFLEKVMPILNRKMPNLKLYLAGRNMPEYFFKKKWNNVIVLGEVADADDFVKDKSILVVPLQSGSGIRIKIFQAMAKGKAIITTSIGIEGIIAADGKEVLIADNPESFASKIIDLCNDSIKIKNMGLAARELIETHYNRKKLIADLLNRFEILLNEG